jgi:hypothetical protein
MLEAMYSIEFDSVSDSGYGVVIFETGRIFGGDSSFVYLGSYNVEKGILKAKVRVTNDRRLLPSIVGFDPFTLVGEADMAGAASCTEFMMYGVVAEAPALKIAVKFTRRAELP